MSCWTKSRFRENCPIIYKCKRRVRLIYVITGDYYETKTINVSLVWILLIDTHDAMLDKNIILIVYETILKWLLQKQGCMPSTTSCFRQVLLHILVHSRQYFIANGTGFWLMNIELQEAKFRAFNTENSNQHWEFIIWSCSQQRG